MIELERDATRLSWLPSKSRKARPAPPAAFSRLLDVLPTIAPLCQYTLSQPRETEQHALTMPVTTRGATNGRQAKKKQVETNQRKRTKVLSAKVPKIKQCMYVLREPNHLVGLH